jgi:predicted phage tail protein
MTLLTKTTARSLYLIANGEIGGLADQTYPLKSVFLNNVPVMNGDGSLNFENVQVEQRYGLVSQPVMKGYPSASATYLPNTKVTTSTPVVWTSTSGDVDAIRVTVRYPALFEQKDNGDTIGTTVQFDIERRLGAGSWVYVRTVTTKDKCTSPADIDYLVERPSGTGVWSVRVVRTTADNTSLKKANDIYFYAATEKRDAQLPYNGYAYFGVTLTTEAQGQAFPQVSFDTNLLKVKVPDNYNVSTRVYTGAWSGTFAATEVVCDNPAWVLYALLTDPTYGMGNNEADVDKFSFYDAAVYNDALVPAVVDGVVSGTEPRYTFNYQFMDQDEAWTLVQNVAATFGAVVYTAGNKVRVVQDRPTTWSRVITNSNVVDGSFEYTSSRKSGRNSACIVYWNDPDENCLSVPAYYEDEDATALYGLNVKEVTGLGVTTEGQALRLAKWHVDTAINNTDIAIFKVGFSNAGLEPGEVIKVADSDFAMTLDIEAKVASSSGGTLVLDRPVEVTSGDTFDVVGSDGVTVYTRTITSTGTSATITFSGAAISVLPGADIVFTGTVSPRLFKVTNVKEDTPGIYTVSALQYDPNKFARVDNTPAGPTPVYQQPNPIPSAPINLGFRESATSVDGVVVRSLMVSWSRPLTGVVSDYVLRYRRDATPWVEVIVSNTSYEVSPATEGQYEAVVYPRTARGVAGPKATATYDIDAAGIDASAFNAPTTLQIVGGGTTFGGQDINFQWTNPSSNADIDATLRDFEVRFIETTGSTTVRTAYFPAVAAGAIQTASYTFAMNTADGGPRRLVQVQVRCRDAKNNLSNPATVTFTNPAPAALTGIGVQGGIGNVKIAFDLPTDTDFKGVLVWRSTTSGFTPASGNLVFDGPANYISDTVDFGTTYYYKLAAYDTFSKPLDGAGLNISAQQAGEANAGEGIPEVSVLPDESGYTGPKIVFLEADGQLYSFIDGAWEPTIPAVSDVTDGSITVAKFASGLRPIEIVGALPSAPHTEGRLIFLTSDDKVYRNTGSGWISNVASGDITGTLNDSQIGDLAAAKLTGQVVAAQIADANITTAKIAASAVVANSIATGAITTDKLLAGAVTTDKLLAGSVTTNKIAAGAITATELATGSVVTGKVAAGAITATEIAASAITTDKLGSLVITTDKLAANAVTAVKIAAGTITSNEIAANTITGGKIAASTITASNIAANTITGDRLVGNTITGDKVAAGTISATNISVASLSALSANLGTVTAGWVSGLKFTTGNFTDYAWPAPGGTGSYLGPSGLLLGNANNGRYFQVTAAGDIYAPGFSVVSGSATFSGSLAASIVTAGSIQSNAVTESKIANLNVSTLKIADNAVTIPVSAFTTSPTTGSQTATGASSSAYTDLTVASISFTSSGNSIKVDSHAEIRFTSGGGYSNNSSFDGLIEVRRGSTVLLAVPAALSGAINNNTTTEYVFPVIPWVVDTPGAGTFTYSVVFRYRKIGGAFTAWCTGTSRSRGIFAIEAKK